MRLRQWVRLRWLLRLLRRLLLRRPRRHWLVLLQAWPLSLLPVPLLPLLTLNRRHELLHRRCPSRYLFSQRLLPRSRRSRLSGRCPLRHCPLCYRSIRRTAKRGATFHYARFR